MNSWKRMTGTTDSGSAKSDRHLEALFRLDEETLTLKLHVLPGARKTEMAGRYGESALRLRIAAPASDGRANQACVRFLAKILEVPPSAVTILRGQASRDKFVRIAPVTPRQLQAFLQQWLP